MNHLELMERNELREQPVKGMKRYVPFRLDLQSRE
jgi:hypothetical protein